MSYAHLTGRTALVTGAASGMGAATARALAAHGTRVVLTARRAERLAALAAAIEADGGRALSFATDVTDPAAVRAAVDRAHEEFGRLDLVVTAAGVMLPNPVAAGRSDEWRRMIDTNLTGTLTVVGAVTPDLIAAAADGGPADLVTLSSIGAHIPFADYAVYGATKAAVTYLAQSLRTELGPRDVRVTNIEPGLTASELAGHVDNGRLAGQLDGMVQAFGSLASEDIADLIAYTVSRPRHVNLRQIVALPTRQA